MVSRSRSLPETGKPAAVVSASWGRWKHAAVRDGEEEASGLLEVHILVVALPYDTPISDSSFRPVALG